MKVFANSQWDRCEQVASEMDVKFVSKCNFAMCRMIIIIIWYNSVVVSGPFVIANGPFQERVPNVAMLRASLESTVRKITHCHLTALNRGDQTSLRSTGNLSHLQTRNFFDVWMSGNHLQFSKQNQQVTSDPWWRTDLTNLTTKPLDNTNVLNSDLLTTCIRDEGAGLIADIRPFRNKPYSGLYSTSSVIGGRLRFYLPLVDLNRVWGTERVTWFAINEIYTTDYTKWNIVSTKMLDQEASEVIVEIPSDERLVYEPDKDSNRGSLTDQDVLYAVPGWKVWFQGNQSNGWFPRRIEYLRKWRLKDQVFDFRRDDEKAPIVFVAEEWTPFEPGNSYPYCGFQESYTSKEKLADRNSSYRKVISEFRQFGYSVDSTPLVLTTRREWKVLKLHSIEPTKDLWIDPPNNIQVYDMDTDKRRIQGQSEAESLRIMDIAGSSPKSPFDIVRWSLIATAIFLAIIVCMKLFFKKNVAV